MSEQQTTPPTAPEAPKAPEAGKQADKTPPWGKPEDFNADKAWELIQSLRGERGDPNALRAADELKSTRLRQEIESMRTAQQQQQDAIAKAFGVKPDEVSDTDKLAQQVGSLQQQILASERRALAAEHKVPESLLTGTDSESMKAQAEALVEFAKGAHVAALTAQPPPPFAANPGQGQGGQVTPEAQAAAEYERFYPSAPSRK